MIACRALEARYLAALAQPSTESKDRERNELAREARFSDAALSRCSTGDGE